MIPFNELKRGYELYKEEYDKKALSVLESGWYILGREVSEFEYEFCEKLGGGYCAGVDNGLNAIVLGIRALEIGRGDEVIVQSNAYIATVMGITMNEATPVFVEPDQYFNIDPEKIQEKISSKTKAVLVTHLYGQSSRMDMIAEICRKNGIYLLEDCAQSHFSKFDGINTGLIGDMGFFSFFPTKNLGCFGDGGAVVSKDKNIIDKVMVLRNYGSNKKYYHEYVGYNSRLDEIQAGMLRVKLAHMEELTAHRKSIAEHYLAGIRNPSVVLPKVAERVEPVWHLFVVRTIERDSFRNYLEENGVMTEIHYPVPVHLSEAYKYLNHKEGDFPIAEEYSKTVVSLPVINNMTDAEIRTVIEVVNNYSI